MRRNAASRSWRKELCASLPFSPAAAGNSGPFSRQPWPFPGPSKNTVPGGSCPSFSLCLLRALVAQPQEFRMLVYWQLQAVHSPACCFTGLENTGKKRNKGLASELKVLTGERAASSVWQAGKCWLTGPKMVLGFDNRVRADPAATESCFPLPFNSETGWSCVVLCGNQTGDPLGKPEIGHKYRLKPCRPRALEFLERVWEFLLLQALEILGG